MADYNYLKPNAKQHGKAGTVEHRSGQFINMPPYPELGGFKNKSCLHEGENRMTLEKSPQAKKGEPI